MGGRATENAYSIAEHGLTIGEKGNQLSTGGAGDWEAPKIHPVWAPEVAHEATTLARMGAATFEYEPQYRKLAEWHAAGKPEIRIDPLDTGQAPRFYVLDSVVTTMYRESDWYQRYAMEQALRQELLEQGMTGRVIVLTHDSGSLAERQLFAVDLRGTRSQELRQQEPQISSQRSLDYDGPDDVRRHEELGPRPGSLEAVQAQLTFDAHQAQAEEPIATSPADFPQATHRLSFWDSLKVSRENAVEGGTYRVSVLETLSTLQSQVDALLQRQQQPEQSLRQHRGMHL
jgi:hypothetical protein